MAESTGDKTEPATPRRRQEARDQGTVASSQDLTGALLLIGGLLLMKWFGLNLMAVLRDMVGQMLSGPSLADLGVKRMGTEVIHTIGSIGVSLAPLLGGAALIIIVSSVAQVGLYFNPQRLAFNLAALNPVQGLSRLFGGGQGPVQMGMNVLKVGLVGMVAYSAIANRLVEIVAIQKLSFLQIFGLGSQLIYAIGMRVGILLLVLAIIDYVYKRFETEREMRMTKQEVKDEMRSMEGDPRMKQRRRQVAVQRAMQKLKKEVPKADVVVTNPTHFAVALQYEEGKMRAPKVVAKGADFMAKRIRELAVEAGVPIVERAPLARAIYRMVDVGDEIPEEFYSAVAEILAYVYELARRARGEAPRRAVAV